MRNQETWSTDFWYFSYYNHPLFEIPLISNGILLPFRSIDDLVYFWERSKVIFNEYMWIFVHSSVTMADKISALDQTALDLRLNACSTNVHNVFYSTTDFKTVIPIIWSWIIYFIGFCFNFSPIKTKHTEHNTIFQASTLTYF